MFLYYLLVEGCINCYDYKIGIPLGLQDMIVVQLALIMIFVSIGLYFHQHDKHPYRKDCSKTDEAIVLLLILEIKLLSLQIIKILCITILKA